MRDIVDRLMAWETTLANEEAEMVREAGDEVLRLRKALATERKTEREACARLFDRDTWPTGRGHLVTASISPREAAAAIRARGET